MGLFGPKKSPMEKYNEKEAKLLKKKYEGEIRAFEARCSEASRKQFHDAVGTIVEKCRPYEKEVWRPNALDDEIDRIAGELQNTFGPEACTYAYVLFAEQMPQYAPFMKDMILDCKRRDKWCVGSFKLEFPTRVAADQMIAVCNKAAEGTGWADKTIRYMTNTFVKSNTYLTAEDFRLNRRKEERTLFHQICRSCTKAGPDIPFTGSCEFKDRENGREYHFKAVYEQGQLTFSAED